MLIENAICDAVRFFHIDALSSAVAMKVDFDMTLLVIASGLYRRLAQRMRGYAECQARQIFRDLIDMPADVTIHVPLLGRLSPFQAVQASSRSRTVRSVRISARRRIA